MLLLGRGYVVGKRLLNTHTPSLNLKKSTLSLSLVEPIEIQFVSPDGSVKKL